MTTSELEAEWQAAVADAGLDPESVILWALPGSSSARGINGLYYARGVQVDDALSEEGRDALNDDLNDPEHLSRDRVCVWTGVPAPLVAARMRHELEHARQCRVHGAALWTLAQLAGDVLAEAIGESPGGAALYNATPIELDASAAAAGFARQRYGHDVVKDLLDSEHADTDGPNLRLQVAPGPLETLPLRTLAFLWLFPTACEAFERRSGTPIELSLEAAWPGAWKIWSRFESLLPSE